MKSFSHRATPVEHVRPQVSSPLFTAVTLLDSSLCFGLCEGGAEPLEGLCNNNHTFFSNTAQVLNSFTSILPRN